MGKRSREVVASTQKSTNGTAPSAVSGDQSATATTIIGNIESSTVLGAARPSRPIVSQPPRAWFGTQKSCVVMDEYW